MSPDGPSKSIPWLAAVGGLLVLPALLVCLAGPLNLKVSNPLISPFLVLGGLGVAFGLNALTVFQVGLHREGGSLVGVLRARLRWPNLALVVVSAGLAASLLTYGFLENFRVVAR